MNLLKTFLLTLLLLPATAWAMESDGFEPWKIDLCYAKKHKRAPLLYQTLAQVAAKKLGVSPECFVPIIAVKDHASHNWVAQTRTFFLDKISRISFMKKFITSAPSFSATWTFMLHEMAHALDADRRISCAQQEGDKQECKKEIECFADKKAVTTLECFECAQKFSAWRHDPDGVLKKEGYLDHDQILELAQKTYGIKAQCPYHKERAKRRPWWIGSAAIAAMQMKKFIELTDMLPASSPSGLFALFGIEWYLIHHMRRKRFEKTIERTLDYEIAHGELKI